jgi:Sigma-70, region 4
VCNSISASSPSSTRPPETIASQDGTYQRGLDTDLVAALRRLPVRQREVVALRLLLDLDTASTAEALGLADGTVGSHLHRALANLRRDLRPDLVLRSGGTGLVPRAGRNHLDPHPGRAGRCPRADLRLASRAADDQELTP